MRTRILKLEHSHSLPNDGSRTLIFVSQTTDRRHPSLVFWPDEVPEADDDEGWFLAERIVGGWRIVLRVQENGEPWRG